MADQVSFPRQYARTGRFTRGAPRAVTVSPDGARITFLRSGSGTDPAAALWVYDVAAATERLVADPAHLLDGGTEELSQEERARRERSRESGAGVVAYATDRAATIAAFALSGRLFLADLVNGGVRELPATAPVVDPRPDPTGSRVADADASGPLGAVITFVDPESGEVITTDRVSVPAGATLAVPLVTEDPYDRLAVTVLPSAAGLYAVLQLTEAVDGGSYLTLIPLRSPALDVEVPRVRYDLSTGLRPS